MKEDFVTEFFREELARCKEDETGLYVLDREGCKIYYYYWWWEYARPEDRHWGNK